MRGLIDSSKALWTRPILLPMVLLLSCGEQPVVPGQSTLLPLDQLVVGEAAANLTDEDLFRSVRPSVLHGRELISEDRARELAVAYVRTFGPMNRSWERERGSAIDVSSLKADDRVYFADTPHGALPDSAGIGSHRSFGPYYLITFRERDEAVLVVAVSAWATDLRIDGRGNVVTPGVSGSEFYSVGLRPALQHLQSATPEEIVQVTGTLLGVRVAQVPRLVVQPEAVPQTAIWWLGLEHPVEVTDRSGRQLSTDVVGVSITPTGAGGDTFDWLLLAPHADQPKFRSVTYISGPFLPVTPGNVALRPVRTSLAVREGFFLRWDTVTAYP